MSNEPDRLEELTKKIRTLMTKEERAERAARPNVCWVSGGDDESVDWCPACCEEAVRHLRAAGKDVHLGGGYGTSSDTSPVCAGCGCDLRASLSLEGCEEEIEHFEMYPPVTLELLDTLESFRDDQTRHPTLYGRLVVLAEALLATLEADPTRRKDPP